AAYSANIAGGELEYKTDGTTSERTSPQPHCRSGASAGRQGGTSSPFPVEAATGSPASGRKGSGRPGAAHSGEATTLCRAACLAAGDPGCGVDTSGSDHR